MDDRIILSGNNFSLSLDFRVFESDVSYASNTILSVSVTSDGFSASATMDIDIKDIPLFCNELKKVYDCLNVEAKIQEPYGARQFILFSGDKCGRISISGTLNSGGDNGLWQELKFENSIDQTYIPRFMKELNDISNQFVK